MEKFSHYKREDYEAEGVLEINPMSAKEPLNDKELEDMLTSHFFYAEEKLDGVRATLHIREEGNRIFSRRISKRRPQNIDIFTICKSSRKCRKKIESSLFQNNRRC